MIGSDVVVAGVSDDMPWAYDYYLGDQSQCNYETGQVSQHGQHECKYA